MDPERLAARASAFSITKLVARLRSAPAALKQSSTKSHFFFGKFAELSALHLVINQSHLSHNLGTVNKFRNELVERIGSGEASLLYEIACGKRLSGQSLFALSSSLNLSSIVAYSNVYLQAPNKDKTSAAFVLEQGGCRVIIDPPIAVLKSVKRNRRALV